MPLARRRGKTPPVFRYPINVFSTMPFRGADVVPVMVEITVKNGYSIVAPIHWAISLGKIPGDIAERLQNALAVFHADTALFDSPDLRGPAKCAELIVKLGYWLAMGQLAERNFRAWADSIPPDDNAGWDVDLLRDAHGAPFQYVLKMGPLVAHPEACLVQEPVQFLSMAEG